LFTRASERDDKLIEVSRHVGHLAGIWVAPKMWSSGELEGPRTAFTSRKETSMDLRRLLDRPIAFHRVFVTITGSVTAALFLSQAFYWTPRTNNPDGWFYKTGMEWEEETGMGRREQETARKLLKKLNLLEERLWGIPARLHYRINKSALAEALRQFCDTSMAESAKL
jgi:hypothetical protein